MLFYRNFDFYRFHNFLRTIEIHNTVLVLCKWRKYLSHRLFRRRCLDVACLFFRYLVDFVGKKKKINKTDFLRAWSRVCMCIDFFWLGKSLGVVRRSSTRKNNSRKILGICVESRCQTEQQRWKRSFIVKSAFSNQILESNIVLTLLPVFFFFFTKIAFEKITGYFYYFRFCFLLKRLL